MTLAPTKLYTEILRKDFGAFSHRAFKELNPSASFEPNWHLDVLAAKLDQVLRGECHRLIVCMPPRHLKSHMISIAFPAFLLGHDPSNQILTISYAQDLADKLARDCRALMISPVYRALFDTQFSEDRNATSEFETTAGGYRLSTSVGGVVTGRGANVIIIDDPMKADDALSDFRRTSLNVWYDNTVRSRLNRQEDGAVIVVMQRLHADDLVAHLLESGSWDVLSFPAIAEKDERFAIETPYGPRTIERSTGDILHPALLSAATLDQLRRGMTEYNFAAQYQQDPQPLSGLIVRREWLKFYDEKDKPEDFEQVIQSWDTANKATELADFSVCTTWGLLEERMYLLDVSRNKLEFPALKRKVCDLADLWDADVVLVEDKASGTQLIQQLRADSFSRVQPAPVNNDDKVMRLRAQTAKIEGQFVLFPKQAHWLDAYLLELTTFPNSKKDDQVDSTVHALAWLTEGANKAGLGLLRYYERLAKEKNYPKPKKKKMTRVILPGESNIWLLITGREVAVPVDRIVEVDEDELDSVRRNGGKVIGEDS